MNATAEDEKVKAFAAIEALKSPSGWDAGVDLGILKEEEGHLAPVITVKTATPSSNSVLSHQMHPNVMVTANHVSLPKAHRKETTAVIVSDKTQTETAYGFNQKGGLIWLC